MKFKRKIYILFFLCTLFFAIQANAVVTLDLPEGEGGIDGGLLPDLDSSNDEPGETFLDGELPDSGINTTLELPTSRNENPGVITAPSTNLFQPTTQTNYFNNLQQAPQVQAAKEVGILNQIVSGNLFGNDPLNRLLNQLFYIGLVAAVILAIVMIIRGGIEYMTIDAIASKESGKRRVQAALGGLVLAFSAILILNTINPGLTSFKIVFKQLKLIASMNIQTDPVTGQPIMTSLTPGSEGSAQIIKINNPDQLNASADGVLTINGKPYAFRSGGGGNGYIPPGTYTVTMNTNEYSDGTRTTDGFVKDGVGFAFNLNNAHDPRTGLYREDLRIHPDGGKPGTIGCVGLQGNSTELLQFKTDLTNLIKENGGRYTITIGK